MDTLMITLEAARVNKRLTQEAAAKELGCTADTLRNYEKGRSYPDIPMIKKMEDLYGIPYSNINFLR
jgi:transcriptional regulator with XRE-family HTH domain